MMLPAVLMLFVRQWKNLAWSHLSVTDKAMFFYAVAVMLSYICTEWKEQAVWGAEGWFMGLISQLMFVAVYFVVSRFGEKIKIWYAIFRGVLRRFSDRIAKPLFHISVWNGSQ